MLKNLNSKTLEKAQRENKAIYLKINSNASYWSKKMAQESSNNQNVSELLKERFIVVNIEKDERPDIERYYQRVYSLMNRQAGGLPLNIFLTPNLEPFYSASYIAPIAVEQQLGFEELLRVISKKQITDYDTLSQKGQEVLEFIHPKEEQIQATKLNSNISKTLTLQSKELLDKNYGGFTKAPKFHNATLLELLLDVYELEKDTTVLEMVLLTLDNMAKGGFYDTKDGGFYAYATNEAWSEAYEVKTTYDNASLASLYLRAYQLTHNEAYKTIAFETLDFMISQQNNSKLFHLKDEKVIASWNALMVRALFKAGSIDKHYHIKALETLEALLSNFYVNGMLYHTQEVKAFLEDYTQLGETLIVAYQYTLDESFLIMATQFANLIIEQYYQQAQWIFSTNEFKIRETIHDGVLPSAISSALSLLLSISSLVDINYKKFVFKTLELHSFNLMRQPLSSPKLTQMMLRYLKDDIIIKSNIDLLKENIDKRETIGYPYTLFKNSESQLFELWNSHSSIKQENSFDKVVSHLESKLCL